MVRFHNISQIDNVSLCQPSNASFGHFNSIVEFFFCEFNFKVIIRVLFILRLGLIKIFQTLFVFLRPLKVDPIGILLLVHDRSLLLGFEIVGSVVPFTFNVLIWNDITGVHFRDQIFNFL